jgi:hypothetical protein
MIAASRAEAALEMLTVLLAKTFGVKTRPHFCPKLWEPKHEQRV